MNAAGGTGGEDRPKPKGVSLLGYLYVVVLGAALAGGVLWFADAPESPGLPGDRGSMPDAAGSPTRSLSRVDAKQPGPGPAREGHAVEPAVIPTQFIGGVFVAEQEGPLTLGAVELWCESGRLAARAQLDEDGSFSAPACATTTCVRLRHPGFEQPIAWELAPSERREFEVAAAPGIIGVVVSPLGVRVPDASLVLRTDDGRRASARTDAAGEFAVAVPGLRPCDACDLERGGPMCSEPHSRGQDRDRLHARVLVSAPEFAPSEFEVELGLEQDAVAELMLDPPAAPITGVVRGGDGALFDSRTKVLATNIDQPDQQHHAQVDQGRFELSGLADARYRLRAVRDGRELAILDGIEPGDEVELRTEQAARGVTLLLKIVDTSEWPVDQVRVDGGPFVGAVSDEQGRVVASDVGAGRYVLRLRAWDCPVVRAAVEITPGQTTKMHQTLRLPSSCEPQ